MHNSNLFISKIRDIAYQISANPESRFWDEDEQGNPQELDNDNIIRYIKNFLPGVGIWNLPEEGAKGIPELSLVFFFENRLEKINSKQFETLIRKVIKEAGHEKVNELMHFKKAKFFGKDLLLSIPELEGRKLLRDDALFSYRFFSNGYIKISSDKVTSGMPYSSLPDDTFIWNDLIARREYRANELEIRSGDRH